MEEAYTIVLNDKNLLAAICGINDGNLVLLEDYLGAPVVCRGNEIAVLGGDEKIYRKFQAVVDCVVNSSAPKAEISYDFIKSLLVNMERSCGKNLSAGCICIPKGIRTVYPKNLHQAEFIDSIKKNSISFGIGPAGTGKTFLATALALQSLLSKEVRKIVLTRPVVEAGENLGFLPGDLIQKITPYLKPLYDTMEHLLPFALIKQMEESGMFEVAPLAYMRGRTLHNAVVILDEAQNTTREQMKMFLTRMGEGSKLIITGDPGQSDISGAKKQGLTHAAVLLRKIEGVGVIEFSSSDVVRHSLVQKIVTAYDKE